MPMEMVLEIMPTYSLKIQMNLLILMVTGLAITEIGPLLIRKYGMSLQITRL